MSTILNRDAQRGPGELVSMPGTSGYNNLVGSIVIQKIGVAEVGPAVAAPAGGFSAWAFAGIVARGVNLTLGTSTGNFDLYQKGAVTLKAVGTPSVTHLLRKAYIIDNDTVGVSAADPLSAGTIVGIDVAAGTYRVLIDRAVGV